MKKKQLKKNTLIVLSLILTVSGINAQVTIGTEKKPEDFSAMEIVSDLGFRLPQLNNTQRDLLPVSEKDLTKGLAIYNLDTKTIEYWDGTAWIRVTTEGDLSSQDLEFDNSNGVVLKDVKLTIKNGVVTLKKMQGASLPSEKNCIYVTKSTDGSVELVDKSTFRPSFAVGNGLTGIEDVENNKYTVKLGGALTKETTIDMKDNSLDLTSSGGEFNISNDLLTVNSQNNRVGINTATPRTTLDIGGSFATGDLAVDITDAGTTKHRVGKNLGQLGLGGTLDEDFILFLPDGIPGWRYILLNNTNKTMNVQTIGKPSIGPMQSMEFAFAAEDWRPTSPVTSINRIYVGQGKIPPHRVSSTGTLDWGPDDYPRNPDYDTSDWFIMAKESKNFSYGQYATVQMILTYQYKGEPFQIDKLYPVLSAVNKVELSNSNYSINITLKGVDNDGVNPEDGRTGRTQFSILVSRTDLRNGIFYWDETFFLNVMLINSAK